MDRPLTVVQMLPALNSGGVERGTLDLSKYLVENGHRSIVIAKPGKMAEELLADGGKLIPWPVGEKSLLTFRFISKVRSLLINQGVDILHLRSRLPAWIGYFAWKSIKQESRPKLVTTVHGPYSVNSYSSVMTKGEHVIAVSEMIRQYVLSNYPKVDPGFLSVIHRGVDPEKYQLGYKPTLDWMDSWYEQYPQTKGKQLLTMPGRLTRWKGQVDFVKAFAKISQQYPNVHGLIVGGHDKRRKQYVDDLKALVARLGVQDKLTLTGVRYDLKEIMSISAVTYSLSNEPEAFGRTSLESLMLGVPVIAYAHGGVKEQMDIMFPSGKVGLGDIEAVANKSLQLLLMHPQISAAADFYLENMLAKTLGLYKEMTN